MNTVSVTKRIRMAGTFVKQTIVFECGDLDTFRLLCESCPMSWCITHNRWAFLLT